MSVDSASHDDVAGLFKRLGARAGAPTYHDFSDTPAAAAIAPQATPAAAEPPTLAVPVAKPLIAPAATPPAVPALPPDASATAATSLQRLFQRLAQVPLQGAGQSPLARLRQR